MTIRLASAVLTLALLATGSPVDDATTSGRVTARPSRAFRFEALDEQGRAIRWDRCGVVRLIFNPAYAPIGARRELRLAAAVIQRWTGLSVRVVGDTATRPSASYGTADSAGRWPAVLVAFVRPSAHLLSDAGDSAETTDMWIADPEGRDRYVTGELLVNAAQNRLYGDGTDHRASRVRLFEHELGHLVGLGHVQDRRSLMYPQILRRAGLSAGDRRGLRKLGPAADRGSRCPE